MRPTPSTSEWSISHRQCLHVPLTHYYLFSLSNWFGDIREGPSSSPQWGCDLGCVRFYCKSRRCSAFSWMTEVVFNIFCVAFRPRPSAVSISSVQVCRQNVLIFVQLFCKCNLCSIHFFSVVIFDVIFFGVSLCFIALLAEQHIHFFYLLSYSGDLHQRKQRHSAIQERKGECCTQLRGGTERRNPKWTRRPPHPLNRGRRK